MDLSVGMPAFVFAAGLHVALPSQQRDPVAAGAARSSTATRIRSGTSRVVEGSLGFVTAAAR